MKLSEYNNRFEMKEIQIPNSQRFQNQGISDIEQNILPQPKKSKRIYICIFLVIVIIVVLSIHYSSFKYQAHDSPFPKQVKQHKQKELIQITHDTQCYTQGLSFINNTHLLQSCGLYRESYFHILEYKPTQTSAQIKQVWKSPIFDKQYFLEGSVVFPKNNLIYLLTWREKVVFRYDLNTLKEVDRLSWISDGWGLTHNNSHLIISDGSDQIYVTDQNLQILETIKVKDHNGKAQNMINQLEWIKQGQKQFVLANIYTTSSIVKIDLKTGEIIQKKLYDEFAKKERKQKHMQVMNGIAYNAKDNNYLLTGKKWGSFYQLNHL